MSRYPSRRSAGRGGSTRQLFDPRVDNPISFNAGHDNTSKRPMKAQHKPVGQSHSGASELDDREDYVRQPMGRIVGKLWQEDSGANMSLIMPAPAKEKTKSKVAPATEDISNEAQATECAVEIQSKEDSLQKDLHKKQLKVLFVALQSIEARIARASAKAHQHPFFQDTTKDSDDDLRNCHNRKSSQKMDTTPREALTDSELRTARLLWSEKMDLHIELAEKYLEIIQFDYTYAVKKSLESLCWKRAIYLVVDQLRQAFKLREERLSQQTDDKDKDETDKQEVLLPKMTETGMIMVNMDDDDYSDDDSNYDSDDYDGYCFGVKKELSLVIDCFNEFLDKADDFYRRLTVMLRSLDEKDTHEVHVSAEDMEHHLQGWRRTRRLRWYKCIPNRGDLARYKWAFVNDKEGLDLVTSRQHLFENAWRWYSLGIWFMPAAGKLYFHLVLLLGSQNEKTDMLNEMHKLYFSTRSIMVRRNAFLNSREGMVVLFENNRVWFSEHVEQPKLQQPKQTRKEKTALSGDAIAGTLIRLHGMLFTKIGLDQFPQTKRLLFENLFSFSKGSAPISSKSSDFDGEHAFWFEAGVLGLSSLYNYDYTSSNLSKLFALNGKRLFPDDTGLAEGETDNEKDETYDSVITELQESVLFSFGIDLVCQMAMELFRYYLDENNVGKVITTPYLPPLPQLPTTLSENAAFLFDPSEERDAISSPTVKACNDRDPEAWIIYVETLLQWMVVNGICVRKQEASLWESLIGSIAANQQLAGDKDEGLVPATFWRLLVEFANALLVSLSEVIRYALVDYHVQEENVGEEILSEKQFARLVMKVLGDHPVLPEEEYMRGLGWVDDMTGRALRLVNGEMQTRSAELKDHPLAMQRKLKVLDYVFALSRQMNDLLQYDPVEEKFIIIESSAEILEEQERFNEAAHITSEEEDEEDEQDRDLLLTETDDAVLLSNKTDTIDEPEEEEDDDMMTQLKKRREELQSMLIIANAEKQQGYRRLPGRIKEREARINYLRDRVIPGQTTLVLDTNCFIGHLEHIKRLIKSAQWVVVVPLVVVTELDGLRGNSSTLGKNASQALSFIEDVLASKKQRTLRIQTSHHHFIQDISIRSEQFVFGETDRNLDDLVLSTCLWWMKQAKQEDDHAPVCLVTGDRNLSVKARARDVEVVPVSGIMRLQPKKSDQ